MISALTPDQITKHQDLLIRLSKPGQLLTRKSSTATVCNPAWFGPRGPLNGRKVMHEKIMSVFRAESANVARGRKAIVMAGPPGAGKGTLLPQLFAEMGTTGDQWRIIDADYFKERLLEQAVEDGSYESWIKPAEVKTLERQGEKFFPLELSALVHAESSIIAAQARVEAMRNGENIVVDTVLADEGSALQLGRVLESYGYDVQVVDVEVPYEVSEARIRVRWEQSYRKAVEGKNSLGGRWVPSEYARDVYDGSGSRSKPEVVARRLAQECAVVSRYRVFRTTVEQAREGMAPVLVVDMSRLSPEAELTRREPRAAIIDAARQEAHDFERNPEARAECEMWEGTLEDGID